MPTINNVCIPNVAPSTPPTTNPFNQMWFLTRALKKAGYKYFGSGNGTVKDTTGLPAADLWNNAPSRRTSVARGLP